LHIKTSQDFLEALVELDILTGTEVFEKKRPYIRYALKTDRIVIDLDLMQVARKPVVDELSLRVREKENAGARFTVARSGDSIASVAIWIGEGRDRQERKIKLTPPQGRFFYHLPFPKAKPLTVAEIMHKAGLGEEIAPEILDLIQLAMKYGVVEAIQ